MTGQLVGHYRILEKIGAGAMGEVFRARDERLGRDVAVKFTRPTSNDNPDHLRRFEQEARAAAALNHPNILAIYDVGYEGGTPYIVSELLHGKTLRHRLNEGPISVREAADYAQQIAQGLIAAHDRLIVHRDLKPENLFLTLEGRVKILDFGVAKLQNPADDRAAESRTTVTRHGAVIGTVGYMSPEQLRAQAVDYRSDIFSFGAILYEMLSGSRAFCRETEVDTITAVLLEEPPEANLDQASIPQGFREVVKHCLEKEPGNRFQSAKDLAFALQTVSGSSPGNGRTSFRRRIGAIAMLPWMLAAVLAAAVALLVVVPSFRAPAPAPTYQRLTSEAGTVYSARFSPDGQGVLYSAAWNGKPVQLFSTVGNSLLAQALALGDAHLLAISKTHELAVALHGSHNGQLETVGGMLARAPMAGGSPKELLPDVRWADFDSEGRLAVVHDVDGNSRLEYPIGNVLYQSGGWISNIRISPQGDKIAFMDHRELWDNRGVVCVVDLAGKVQTLTKEWESEQGLAWQRDGREIWFTAIQSGTNLNLMAVSLAGKVRTVLDLPMGITLQDVAADGRMLFALNSKRLEMAFGTVGGAVDEDLSWHDWNVAKDISPDGKFVLFEDSSEAAGPQYAVVQRRLDGTLPVVLGEGSSGGLSPDGKWAVAISNAHPRQVTLLPIGAGQPRTVEIPGLERVHSAWARFLPDGQHLIANANESQHSPRCYLLDLSGAKPRALTPERVLCGPSSPDGGSLIGVGPKQSLAIYGMQDQAPRSIPGVEASFQPVQWSTDGSALFGYHIGELPGRIYKVDIATGKETLLQELRPQVPAGVVNIAPVVVNRDGTRFAYSYNQTLSVLYLASGLH